MKILPHQFSILVITVNMKFISVGLKEELTENLLILNKKDLNITRLNKKILEI